VVIVLIVGELTTKYSKPASSVITSLAMDGVKSPLTNENKTLLADADEKEQIASCGFTFLAIL
jgi:hypothetical protein